MSLRGLVLTFDAGEPVLHRVTVREHFRRDRTTRDVTGAFTYTDRVRLTPARRRALLALLLGRR